MNCMESPDFGWLNVDRYVIGAIIVDKLKVDKFFICLWLNSALGMDFVSFVFHCFSV